MENTGNNELISIIVPVYNVEDHLRRCIDSILAQSYGNIEVIAVDDGSTDASGSILDGYAAHDNRVRVIHKANEGVASARNRGLDIFTGSYVGFADADDYLEEDMFKRLYESVTEDEADMAACGYYEEYTDRTDEHSGREGRLTFDKEGAYREFLKMGGCLGSGCWNKLFRAEAVRNIRFKPYRTGEDVEFVCRAIDNCEKAVSIPYIGYHYVHRHGSATRAGFGPANLDVLKLSNEMLDFVTSRHPGLYDSIYAFHAAWHSAQIQVMYWSRDISGYRKESEFIRKNIRLHLSGYIGNKYITKADRIFIAAFMLRCYRPVKWLYDRAAGVKR